MNGTHLILDRAAVAVAGPPKLPDTKRIRFADLMRGSRVYNSAGNVAGEVTAVDSLAVWIAVTGVKEPLRFPRSTTRPSSIALDYVPPGANRSVKIFLNQHRDR